MIPITLKCFKCGKTLDIEVNQKPQFGFELADYSRQVGWKFGLDFYRHRTLIFCSDECEEKSWTKQGTYRLRPLANSKRE